MSIISRLLDIADWFVSKWPTPLAGSQVRGAAWKSELKSCGVGVSFGENLTIQGYHRITIGKKTSIMSGSYLYANDNGLLDIGDNCSFNHNVFLGAAGGEIHIGNDVLIGPNVVLRAAEHIFDNPDRPTRQQGHRGGTIVIGNNVWLASNVVVTTNVKIGDGVVVGAGSVVTKDLPAMTVCVGVPAKPIRKRV